MAPGSNKERLREITENIEQGIKELFSSDRYAEYLSTMSRFHHYSANNVMLIHMQMPEATHVAGFNKWRDQFGRYVKKGERGIKIIAPAPYRKKVEEIRRDPDTHAPLLDKDGKVIMDEKEIRIPMFRIMSVFDVSQTEGKPLPQLARDLKGDVQNYEIFLEALRRASPVPIIFEKMAASMDGYFSAGNQSIAIREGMSEVQTVSAAIHEIAHSKLHNPELDNREPVWRTVMVSEGGTRREYIGGFASEKEAEAFAESENWRFVDENGFEWQLEVEEDGSAAKETERSRQTEEVEAESISYTVCQYYGIETGENSFGYIAAWSKGRELKELKSSLELINKTAGSLIDDIDRNFAEVCKERGVEPAVEEQEISIQEQAEDRAPDTPEPAAEAGMAETPAADAAEIPAVDTGKPVPDMPPVTSEQAALDEYPMPDAALNVSDLESAGYLDGDMLPLTKERAAELLERDFTVYGIVDGGQAELMLDEGDIDALPMDGVFAVPREEWEGSKDFDSLVQERRNHQEEREAAFLSFQGDCFAIYQVKGDEALHDIRFEPLDRLKSAGHEVERGNYDLVYTAPLPSADNINSALNNLWYRFNQDHPADYHSQSMSVSDIIAIRKDGRLSCHYCDRFGFTEVNGFLERNPLKNEEMSVEDDYGMIDGIINNGEKQPTVAELEKQARAGKPISLLDLMEAVRREEDPKRKSVMGQIRTQPKREHNKKAPKKSAEREI